MLPAPLLDIMAAQAGVLSRRQVLEHGLDGNDLERLVRRKEWARVRDREDDALALAADVCQQRRSTPGRILLALDAAAGGRTRVRHGAELRVVLHDVAGGTMSLLEHRHLVAVERAHGLPPALRQRREPGPTAGAGGSSGSGTVYRDARYEGFGVVVELDGRLGREWTVERGDDMDRDLDAGADGTLSLRMGWRHVSRIGACRSAIRLGRVLRARGWRDWPRPCGTCPVTALGGTSPAPGAGEIPPEPRPSLTPGTGGGAGAARGPGRPRRTGC